MFLRTIVLLCCLMVHFGNGQSNVLSNSVNNNSNNDVVKKCAGFNEYCQTNTDCCSRNCLSFSYKCIRERVEQPELPTKGNQQPELPFAGAPAGNAGSVQELVDRFGSDGERSTPVTAPLPRPPFPPPASTVISNGGGFQAPVASTPPQPQWPAINSNRPCLASGGNCLYSNQCCAGFCSRITNKCIVGNEQSQFEPQRRSSTPFLLSCSRVIGSKCYRYEDCCEPLHCHDFLHQCVT